jgi:hypothetical protein
MGHSGNQSAERLHFLRLLEPLFGFAQGGLGVAHAGFESPVFRAGFRQLFSQMLPAELVLYHGRHLVPSTAPIRAADACAAGSTARGRRESAPMISIMPA